VHPGTLRALDQGLRLPFDRLDRLALGREPAAEARALLSRFLRFHVGLELRSEPFLDATLAGEASRALA
jgi:recombinational DNA repair protein (RecF pathway)